LGWHGSYEEWHASGKPGLVQEARQRIQEILSNHNPLPLSEDRKAELEKIEQRAMAS
jgi:trimethylamine:corrinoid methyltransferase-like protein